MPANRPSKSFGQMLHDARMKVAEVDALAARTITDPKRREYYLSYAEEYRRAIENRLRRAAGLHGQRISRSRKALMAGTVTPETYLEDVATSSEAFRQDQIEAAANYIQAIRLLISGEATNDTGVAERAKQFLLQRKADSQ